MPKSLILKLYLSSEELKQRYRNSSDPVERSHYQIIWLLASGKTVPEVSSITGYSTKWIYQLASRYNQSGAQGLSDRRHQNQGYALRSVSFQSPIFSIMPGFTSANAPRSRWRCHAWAGPGECGDAIRDRLPIVALVRSE